VRDLTRCKTILTPVEVVWDFSWKLSEGKRHNPSTPSLAKKEYGTNSFLLKHNKSINENHQMKLFSTLFYALLATSSLSSSAPVGKPSSSDTLSTDKEDVQPSVQLEARSPNVIPALSKLVKAVSQVTTKLDDAVKAVSKNSVMIYIKPCLSVNLGEG
jgi:hypothetical protein